MCVDKNFNNTNKKSKNSSGHANLKIYISYFIFFQNLVISPTNETLFQTFIYVYCKKYKIFICGLKYAQNLKIMYNFTLWFKI